MSLSLSNPAATLCMQEMFYVMMCKQNLLVTAVTVGGSVASFNNLQSVRNANSNHLKPTGHFMNRRM